MAVQSTLICTHNKQIQMAGNCKLVKRKIKQSIREITEWNYAFEDKLIEHFLCLSLLEVRCSGSNGCIHNFIFI